MRTFLPLMFLAACQGAGGGAADFYARFERLGALPSAQTGAVTDVFEHGGELYVVGAGLHTLDGETRLADARFATVLDGDIVVAGNSGVFVSSDGVAFDPVSTEVFDVVRAVDGALVGARVEGAGTMGVWRSADGGATWTSLGTQTLGAVENESVWLSAAVDGLVWARISGDADLGPNWSYAARTFEVRGEAVTEVQPASAGGPLPDGETLDGRALINVETLPVGSGPNRPHDLLPIALVGGYTPVDDLEGTSQIAFAMPDMPVAPPDVRTFGVDGEGRLLAAFDDTLVRSELPLTRANDQSGEVLQGAGCSVRADFDGYSGDPPDLTVENATAGPLTLWMVDDQYRWFPIEDVAAGESVAADGFTVRAGYVAMVLDADGNCRGARWLKKEGKAYTLTGR